MIPFNKPHFSGKETQYIEDALRGGYISGNGKYTKKCQRFFEERYGFGKCLLTTSCSDALEMAAILLNIQPGDEVIVPSYTFVSTANAFVRQGAHIVFADSLPHHPNMDVSTLEALITKKTKAIVPVHYAGVACEMDAIMALASKYGLYVVEDAAQAIDSFYTGKDGLRKPLGSIGHMATFSFHETKNLTSGEGGMLVINDPQFVDRAEVVWEKGTNRAAFFRGEVDKYGWVDVGSSFLPSDILAAFLWAQIENLDDIQNKRKQHWNTYYSGLHQWAKTKDIMLQQTPDYATNNAHMFYMVCKNLKQRSTLINHLKTHGILAVFHYLSLHQSPFYCKKYNGRTLSHSDKFSNTLVRLPFYYELSEKDIDHIVTTITTSI